MYSYLLIFLIIHYFVTCISLSTQLLLASTHGHKVSIDLLPQFSKTRNGFPICDLQDGLNYYFTVKHIKQEGLEQMESILQKIENKIKLKIDELILYELHIAPFDIWHFSYRYDLPLDKVKLLISEMEYKGWIVHLSDSEDLLRYIDV